jgi:hypothetical protein
MLIVYSRDCEGRLKSLDVCLLLLTVVIVEIVSVRSSRNRLRISSSAEGDCDTCSLVEWEVNPREYSPSSSELSCHGRSEVTRLFLKESGRRIRGPNTVEIP